MTAMIDSNEATGPTEPARFGLPGSISVRWDMPAGLPDVQVVAQPARRRVSAPLVVVASVLLSAGVVRWMLPASMGMQPVAVVPTERWSPREASAWMMAQVHRGVVGERRAARPDEQRLARDLGVAAVRAIDAVRPDAGVPAEEKPVVAKASATPRVRPTMFRTHAILQKKISDNCHEQVTERVDFAVLHTIEDGRVTGIEFKSKADLRGKGCVKSLLDGHVSRLWLTSTPPLPSGAPSEWTYFIEPKGS